MVRQLGSVTLNLLLFKTNSRAPHRQWGPVLWTVPHPMNCAPSHQKDVPPVGVPPAGPIPPLGPCSTSRYHLYLFKYLNKEGRNEIRVFHLKDRIFVTNNWHQGLKWNQKILLKSHNFLSLTIYIEDWNGFGIIY